MRSSNHHPAFAALAALVALLADRRFGNCYCPSLPGRIQSITDWHDVLILREIYKPCLVRVLGSRSDGAPEIRNDNVHTHHDNQTGDY